MTIEKMIPLTPHQRRIIDLKTRGFSGREIAKECKVSERSVKDTLQNVYKVIHVRLDSTDNRKEREIRIIEAYERYLERLEKENEQRA
jgi:DNA-binding NarL/FixJ family response regulator